nr:MAG TPA: hypothetical protein [Caudoviricetes sp.]
MRRTRARMSASLARSTSTSSFLEASLSSARFLAA